jgi:CelD/BcsL family acetyltransferase involved in cellulose biosynthesis
MNPRCPNTFNHPDWMRAITAQRPDAVHVAVPATGLPRLSAILRKRQWPTPHYEGIPLSLTSTDLPSAGMAPSAIDILNFLEGLEAPVLLRNLPTDHPVTQALLATTTQVKVLHQWQRAGLLLNGSFENWLQNNFDQKRRKELKRLRARLSEQGKLESISFQAGDHLAPFIDAFLQLEAQGWKGKRGTAIANDPAIAATLKAGLHAMHAGNRLKFWQINFDDAPIASLFALVDDGEVTLGKIAYAEAYSKYSPGVLIILDATQELLTSGIHVRADSNALPDHPMIDRLWRDRITCQDMLLAGPTTPTPVFQLLSQWIGMKYAAKRLIKRVLAQRTGRKIS